MDLRKGMRRPEPRFEVEDGYPYFATGSDCPECRGVGEGCEACSGTGWQLDERFGLHAWHAAVTAGVVTKVARDKWKAWAKDHLCARCKCRMPIPGNRTCLDCRAAFKIVKQQRRERGLCVRCGSEPSVPGKTSCERCVR